MPGPARARAIAALGVTLLLWPVGSGAARAQQRPVFRGGTNLVTVDAYPRLGGRVVHGLTPADFDVFEDGVRQKIDQFEFVEAGGIPDGERVDPDSQRDMLQQAADPHNRVFVVYLDVYDVGLTGSHDIRGPLVNVLDRIIAPGDLFGLTTSKATPASLVLGRRTQSVADQLSRFWPWGERNRLGRDPDDPVETYLDRCFPDGGADDDGTARPMADVLIERRREDRTLGNLRDVISYVGGLREARTSVLVVSDGWRVFRPDGALASAGAGLLTRGGTQLLAPPPVGIAPGGRITADTGLSDMYSAQACGLELARLAALDDRQAFQQIIALANRKNVVMYPIAADGLQVTDLTVQPAMQTPLGAVADMDHQRSRVDAARTLAAETDGLAVVDTNDLRGGLQRVVDDVSAYYLLGYYSTDPKADGRFRKITVQVRRPGVAVVSRRGYVATPAASVAGSASATDPAPARVEADAALNRLARIDTDVDLFTYGVASGQQLSVVAEIPSEDVELGTWTTGGQVVVTALNAAGEPAGRGEGRIAPGTRAALVQVPVGTTPGPWRIAVTVTGASGRLQSSLEVSASRNALLGDPLIYRSPSGPRAFLQPVADFLFRRTERIHVEFPVRKPLDRRSIRVLDSQRLQPLPIGATLTERDQGGDVLAADLTLSPLAGGDYLLDVSVGSAAESERRQVAFRVGR